MHRWFLSYNSQDIALMQGLEDALRRKDAEAHIFFAPRSLRAGGYWLPELSKEIAEATAFVLLVGEKGLGPWQVIEYYEALDRRVKEHDFPVVLVLLDGQPAPGLPFLRQLHWIITADPASEQSLARLMDGAAGKGSLPGELWRHTAPYRGLAAMTEADADFFFGRGRETAEAIRALADMPDKLPVLLGNSGVGKSSLAQAGVLAALMRQEWPEAIKASPLAARIGPWPCVFADSRRWCFLKMKPGTEPVRSLVEPFLSTWHFDAVDPCRAELMSSWVDKLIEGRVSLRDLLDATQARYRDELHKAEPPAFLLYVDQGEELYVRGEERQRRRFSEIVARDLSDPRLRALMSMRADFFGELQKDAALYGVHQPISVPPLREAQLREVVSRPAALLGAHFESDHLAAEIARLTAEESTKDGGALPLLSYLLDDMWTKMVSGGGTLRLPAQAIELGGVLAQRADAFLAAHPNSRDTLRRILTLKLATVRRNGEPTGRRALRSEFTDEEWRLVSALADHPNRLLVTATPEVGEVYAEVAHETIFRRWEQLREWIGAELEFLAWRTGLEAARRAWQATPDRSKNDALLMGLPLGQGQFWLARRREDIPEASRDFIIRSRNAAQRRRRRQAVVVGLLALGFIAGLVGWLNEAYLRERVRWITSIRPYMMAQIQPYVLAANAERGLKAADSFRECAKDCPEMIVVPAGEFLMGSPSTEEGRGDDERQHLVTLTNSFAVSKFAVTFGEWDACVAYGDCEPRSDSGWGRGRQPVINITWDDAQRYVAWLSRLTARPYRLLTEAEFEYAARAGTTSAYAWGDKIGKLNANCRDCGSKWGSQQTAPVGSFKPNAFGLYDMQGNVWQWVEDCYHASYSDAPTDGSAVTTGDCYHRVVRGGAWNDGLRGLRSAVRYGDAADDRSNVIGFRVGRTLIPRSLSP